MTIYKQVLACCFALLPLSVVAQVGEFRKDLAVGVNGGYVLSSVGFTPKVPQDMLGGATFGITARYTCEKYFSSICAIVAELNYAQIGWKEKILTLKDEPVPLLTDETQTLQYSRKMSYIQIPILARLGWGRERKGFQAFAQVGPQIGFFLSDKIETNFDVRDPAFNPNPDKTGNCRLIISMVPSVPRISWHRTRWLWRIRSIMVWLLPWAWSSVTVRWGISWWKVVTIMVLATSMAVQNVTISQSLTLETSSLNSLTSSISSGLKTQISNKLCSKDNLKDYSRWL